MQIQNRATLGGNIANASPAADAVPILMAAEATLVLASASGSRRIPVTEFFTGYRRTQLAPDELLYAVEIPPLPGPAWFRKVGTRAANAISKVVLCGRARRNRPASPFGSVAPAAVRVPRTEAALGGGRLAGGGAAALLLAEIAPIDDLRSTAATAGWWRLGCSGNSGRRRPHEPILALVRWPSSPASPAPARRPPTPRSPPGPALGAALVLNTGVVLVGTFVLLLADRGPAHAGRAAGRARPSLPRGCGRIHRDRLDHLRVPPAGGGRRLALMVLGQGVWRWWSTTTVCGACARYR